MQDMLKIAIKAALEGANGILEVYHTNDFDVTVKADQSPLTRADQESHNRIVEVLTQTAIPILSEEGRNIDYTDRKNWTQFWLIDPLDGTKEFIKRNGEFTVNIALIEEGLPVLGVIYVPVSKELYFAEKEMGSFKVVVREDDCVENCIKEAEKLPLANPDKFTAVVSRSHMSQETEDYLGELVKQRVDAGLTAEIDFISRGSSLKICMVAEGMANVYPRFGPTMEWDTAAGHAIAKSAGKQVYRTDNGEELCYNKKVLLNPFFVVK